MAVRLVALACGMVLMSACGVASHRDTTAAFDAARGHLIEARTYHVEATVRSPKEIAETFDGTYDIDFEGPDRYRSIKRAGTHNTNTISIVIGRDVYTSSDGAGSWSHHRAMGDESSLFARKFPELFERVCRTETEAAHLVVSVPSRRQGCDDPLNLRVELSGNRIKRVQVKLPTEIGSLSIDAKFDFERSIEPIVKPDRVA